MPGSKVSPPLGTCTTHPVVLLPGADGHPVVVGQVWSDIVAVGSVHLLALTVCSAAVTVSVARLAPLRGTAGQVERRLVDVQQLRLDHAGIGDQGRGRDAAAELVGALIRAAAGEEPVGRR